jgi:hypothetical protein
MVREAAPTHMKKWHKLTIEFTCPACGQRCGQRAYVNAETDNVPALLAMARRRGKLRCTRATCLMPLRDNYPVDSVKAGPATDEEVKRGV